MTNNDTIKEALRVLQEAAETLFWNDMAATAVLVERAIDTVERRVEALKADNAALLEEAHKACSTCHGKLTYEMSCPYCGDSTYDHDCVEETRPCSAAIHARLSEPHPGAELLDGMKALRNRVMLLVTERDALGSQLLDVQQECIAQRKRADAADTEVKAVLDNMPGAIRVCEGGGPEDIYKSLAVSVGMLTTKAASLECKLAKAEARAEKAEETLRCIGERLVAEGASRDVPILELLNTLLEREGRLKRERDVFREGLKSAAKCLGNGIPFIAGSNAKNALATARIAILALVNGPVPQRPSAEGKS